MYFSAKIITAPNKEQYQALLAVNGFDFF